MAWDLFLTLLPVTFLKILKLEPRSLALTASWNGAAILGPLVGGWLIDAFSWHWVFYINIPIGLIALIICLIYYKPVTSEKNTSLRYSWCWFVSYWLAFILDGCSISWLNC